MGRRHTVLLQSSGRALGLGDAGLQGLQERQVLKGVVTLWHSCTRALRPCLLRLNLVSSRVWLVHQGCWVQN